MVCERCGTVFCWDEAGESASRRDYCSDTCKRAAKRRRTAQRNRTQAAQLARCTQQGKRRYADDAEAADVVRRAARHGKTLHPYECACGWWHLTSNRQEYKAVS